MMSTVYRNKLTEIHFCQLYGALYDVPLVELDSTKFLGVIISYDLKWNNHIDVVLNKISKNIGIIAKVRHLLPLSHTCTLYRTLVEPYISYCILVWAGHRNRGSLDKILKIQKKYVRLITFSDFRAKSKPLFIQLEMLTVYDMYNRVQLAIFMFKCVNNMMPLKKSLKLILSQPIAVCIVISLDVVVTFASITVGRYAAGPLSK